ncbi:hypothetical protein B0H19DRAFT_1185048 [Mycena capillaripes]|nr:hypothetical protein B0H19DRAFT_1185048 [Mycena capillaripes]
MLQVQGDPAFPPELERYICEIAVSLHPQSLRRLILVSRRVKIWMEPLLYKVLTIYSTRRGTLRQIFPRYPSNALAHLFDGRSTSFFHDHVRHICFVDYHSPEFIAKVLSACDATVNLMFLHEMMGDPTLLPILDGLPLQRLSVCLDRLFYGVKFDFSRTLFDNITHLDILDWRDEGYHRWSVLAEMPRLTHLSFSFHDYVPYNTCKAVLTCCRRLQVLAVLCSSEDVRKRFNKQRGDLETDPRFVIVMVSDDLLDWEIGAYGGEDYWGVADAMVKGRRLGIPMPMQEEEEEDTWD